MDKTIKLFRGAMARAFVVYHGERVAGMIYAIPRQGRFEAHLPDGTAHRYNVSLMEAARSLLNGPTDCDLGRCKHNGCVNGIF